MSCVPPGGNHKTMSHHSPRPSSPRPHLSNTQLWRQHAFDQLKIGIILFNNELMLPTKYAKKFVAAPNSATKVQLRNTDKMPSVPLYSSHILQQLRDAKILDQRVSKSGLWNVFLLRETFKVPVTEAEIKAYIQQLDMQPRTFNFDIEAAMDPDRTSVTGTSNTTTTLSPSAVNTFHTRSGKHVSTATSSLDGFIDDDDDDLEIRLDGPLHEDDDIMDDLDQEEFIQIEEDTNLNTRSHSNPSSPYSTTTTTTKPRNYFLYADANGSGSRRASSPTSISSSGSAKTKSPKRKNVLQHSKTIPEIILERGIKVNSSSENYFLVPTGAAREIVKKSTDELRNNPDLETRVVLNRTSGHGGALLEKLNAAKVGAGARTTLFSVNELLQAYQLDDLPDDVEEARITIEEAELPASSPMKVRRTSRKRSRSNSASGIDESYKRRKHEETLLTGGTTDTSGLQFLPSSSPSHSTRSASRSRSPTYTPTHSYPQHLSLISIRMKSEYLTKLFPIEISQRIGVSLRMCKTVGALRLFLCENLNKRLQERGSVDTLHARDLSVHFSSDMLLDDEILDTYARDDVTLDLLWNSHENTMFAHSPISQAPPALTVTGTDDTTHMALHHHHLLNMGMQLGMFLDENNSASSS
uniref:Uncharacterized protein n=1 Tax=Percolomonas cosmopolitus TaxID=63605 RepID=A0A6U0KHR5_9EUKA|mmetsp:Transcript_4279/g.16127  ORF Transcript_4279/g.16127 Transcript_4279/m.16127 type:complete len:639 (+) Transcript_4279:733-2649(+)